MKHRVCYVLRAGAERKPGGDAVQLLRTSEALNELSTHFESNVHEGVRSCCREVVHIANLNLPVELLVNVRKLKRQGAKVVISPIYHPLSWEHLHLVPNPLVRRARAGVSALLGLARNQTLGPRDISAILRNPSHLMRDVLEMADGLVFLADSERGSIASDLGWEPGRGQIATTVYNGTSVSTPASAVGHERFGVACLGRIEPRKNQLSLIRRWPESVPLYIAGAENPRHRSYVQDVQHEADRKGSVHLLGRLNRGEVDRLLRSVRCHVLPSYSEVAPLVDLEALAAGCIAFSTENSHSMEAVPKLRRLNPCDLDIDAVIAAHDDYLPQSTPELITWKDVAYELSEVYSELTNNRRKLFR